MNKPIQFERHGYFVVVIWDSSGSDSIDCISVASGICLYEVLRQRGL